MLVTENNKSQNYEEKTITLMRKRWFFSKVLRIEDGQEYLSIKIVCDTNIKLYFTSYSTALWTKHSTISRWQLKKWPRESCMTKVSLLSLLFTIKTHTRDIYCLLWHFLTIPVVLWWLIIQQYSIIFMAEITEQHWHPSWSLIPSLKNNIIKSRMRSWSRMSSC